MSTDAFEQFCAFALTYREQHPEQRDGQAHSNALYDAHPALSDQIRGVAGLDPFYLDENLGAFMAFVREHLEDR